MSKVDSRFSPLFLILACSFVTSLLISNIIAGKLANFCGVVLPAAVILFPVTYIFGDVLTEVYGFRRARLVIWLGLGANVMMTLLFMVVLALPYPEFWTGQSAYATVLGFTPRLVLASLVAYWVGELLNSVVLSRLKVKTNGRFLWMRTILSTVVGEGADTMIFIGLGFGWTVPLTVLTGMMVAQYLWKVGYEVLLTPVTYLVVRWVKQKEQLDVYDHDVKYHWFKMEV